MTNLEAARTFRKHYRYAMHLKEGGKAWDREMAVCNRCLRIILDNCEKEREAKIWNELYQKEILKEIHCEENDKPLTEEQVEELKKPVNFKVVFSASKPVTITTDEGIWRRVKKGWKL